MWAQLAAAAAPAAINALGQTLGQTAGAAAGNVAGKVAGAGMNAGNTKQQAKEWIESLDPREQQELLAEMNERLGQQNLRRNMESSAFGAQLLNQASNAQTERQMALEAQRNAANNVANQLSNLREMSANSAREINNAMGLTAGIFR